MPQSSGSIAQQRSRLALAIALGTLGLWIASSFLPALAWAVVIAIAIDPLCERAPLKRLGQRHPTQLAALVTIAFALLVLVPIAIGIARAAREASDLANWIAMLRTQGMPVPDWVEHIPFAGARLSAWWLENLATAKGGETQFLHLTATGWISQTRLIGAGVAHRLIIFGFTLATLFFLLRDRAAIITQLRAASDRLLGPAGERIGRQAVLSVRGTIDGLVLVGIGEGMVLTVLYIVFGVPHPLLLGAVTAVAAMIPVGAALAILLAGALLLLHGATGAAIALIVIALLLVFIADHTIRPMLIGNATRLPFLWVLIGILGGVETLGMLGLFVGPATMAVLFMLWREYVETPRG